MLADPLLSSKRPQKRGDKFGLVYTPINGTTKHAISSAAANSASVLLTHTSSEDSFKSIAGVRFDLSFTMKVLQKFDVNGAESTGVHTIRVVGPSPRSGHYDDRFNYPNVNAIGLLVC